MICQVTRVKLLPLALTLVLGWIVLPLTVGGDARAASSSEPVPASLKASNVLVESMDETAGDVPPKVEIIIDGSGSMGKMLGKDKSKMYYSKKLLASYLGQQWKEHALIGLRVYGSRRRRDCKDSYLAVNFHEKSLYSIETKIANMDPLGMTPIQDSLEAGIKDLKSYRGPKRLVLFTDGEETCGGDPCQLMKDVGESKLLDFKLYVVGIGFDPKGRKALKSLQCMAAAGDPGGEGKPQLANTPDELSDALGKISAKIFKHNNLFVRSPNAMATVSVFKHGSGPPPELVTSFPAGVGGHVPPGDYDVVVDLTPPYNFPTVAIPPGKRVTLDVQGQGKIMVRFSSGLMDVDLLDQHQKVVHRMKSDRVYLAKSGRYRVKIDGPPFYSKTISQFYVYPSGKHLIDIDDAGALQIGSPDTRGLYVYNSSGNLVGTYMTNVPFVVRNGSYRVYVDEKCYFPKVNVGGRGLQHFDCPVAKDD